VGDRVQQRRATFRRVRRTRGHLQRGHQSRPRRTAGRFGVGDEDGGGIERDRGGRSDGRAGAGGRGGRRDHPGHRGRRGGVQRPGRCRLGLRVRDQKDLQRAGSKFHS